MSARFLRLDGRLTDDGRLLVRLGGITTTPPSWPEDVSSPIVAEVFDANHTLLMRRRVTLDRVCICPPAGAQFAIGDYIPLRDDAARIAIVREGVTLEEFTLSTAPPSVQLRWQPDGPVRGVQTVSWEGSHPEQHPLHFIVRFSRDDGRTWQPVSLRVHGRETPVDFDALPGGDRCRLKVEAHDGLNVAFAVSDTFSVPTKRCRPIILAPSEGITFEAGDLVILRGQGYYLEERRPETSVLIWRSARDGEVGRGMEVETRQLSIGDHTITLRVGEGERTGEATVTVRIVEKRLDIARN